MRALQLLALPALLDPAVSTLRGFNGYLVPPTHRLKHDDAPALRGVPPTTLAPPLPPWKGTYEMRQSTIAMPCNQSGWFNAEIGASYGLVSYDCECCSSSLPPFTGLNEFCAGSNAKQLWANTKPMDAEERMVTQAAMTKAKNPDGHVWVYRCATRFQRCRNHPGL